MGKDIAKSIRISQEALDFINSHPGNNFNDKLCNLIILMDTQVPEKLAELRFVDQCIENRKKELVDLRLKIDRLRSLLSRSEYALDSLDRVLDDTLKQFPAGDIPAASPVT